MDDERMYQGLQAAGIEPNLLQGLSVRDGYEKWLKLKQRDVAAEIQIPGVHDDCIYQDKNENWRFHCLHNGQIFEDKLGKMSSVPARALETINKSQVLAGTTSSFSKSRQSVNQSHEQKKTGSKKSQAKVAKVLDVLWESQDDLTISELTDRLNNYIPRESMRHYLRKIEARNVGQIVVGPQGNRANLWRHPDKRRCGI